MLTLAAMGFFFYAAGYVVVLAFRPMGDGPVATRESTAQRRERT